MKFVITQDESPTIYDETFKEHHHSLVGAYTEAFYKFAKLAEYIIKSETKIKLLDLPFGLGYNLIATLDLSGNQTFIECTAIEKDFQIIEQIAFCPFKKDLKEKFNKIKALSSGQKKIEQNNFSVNLIIDDLLVALPKLEEKFNLIYYDAFSPRVAPELWAKETVLKYLAQNLDESGLLITYTASNKVRKGLLELGLNIAPTEAIGRKMPGTIVSKQKLINRFSQETWQKIQKAQSY